MTFDAPKQVLAGNAVACFEEHRGSQTKCPGAEGAVSSVDEMKILKGSYVRRLHVARTFHRVE
jgi:hypothetical protein